MSSPGLDACRRLADHAGVAFVTLEPTPGAEDSYQPPDPAAHGLLPAELCLRLEVLPIAVEGETIVVASAKPVEYLPYDVAVALEGRPVRFVVAPEDQLARALRAVGGSPAAAPPLQPPGGQV